MSADYTLEELKLIFSGEQFRSKNLVSLASALYVDEIEADSLGPVPASAQEDSAKSKKKRRNRKKKGGEDQNNETTKKSSTKSSSPSSKKVTSKGDERRQSSENEPGRKHSTNSSNQSCSNVCFELPGDENDEESVNTSLISAKSTKTTKNNTKKNQKMKRNSESQVEESVAKSQQQQRQNIGRQKHKSINVPDNQCVIQREDTLGEIEKCMFRSNYNLQAVNNAKPIKVSKQTL